MLELSSSLQDTARFLKALLEIPGHVGEKKKEDGRGFTWICDKFEPEARSLQPRGSSREGLVFGGDDGEPARGARLPRCPAPFIRLPARRPTEPQTDLERRGLDLRGPSEESHSLYF